MKKPIYIAQQSGISLIELLIGSLIGLILLAGVGSVYLASVESNNAREQMSFISDNARFAIEHMNRNLRMANHDGSEEPKFSANKLTVETSYGEISYELDGDIVRFTNLPDIDSVELVNNIADWEVEFGIGDSDGNIKFEDASDSASNVWMIRITLVFDYDSDVQDDYQMSENQRSITTNTALRNPLLEAAGSN